METKGDLVNMQNTKPIGSYKDLAAYNEYLITNGLKQYEILKVSTIDDILFMTDGDYTYNLPLMSTLIEFITEPKFCFKAVKKLLRINYYLLYALAFPNHFQSELKEIVTNLLLVDTKEIVLGKMLCEFTLAANNTVELILKEYKGSQEIIYLPECVTKIGKKAFCKKSKLKKVVSYAKNIEIGTYAFYNCRSLQEIVTPNGTISKLNMGCFGMCTELKKFKLSDELVEIPLGAFEYCNSLKSLKLPRKLKIIGSSSFNNATSLKKIDFSNCKNLREIYSDAFKNSGLTSVDLSNCNNLKQLMIGSFTFCKNLKTLDISNTQLKEVQLHEILNRTHIESIKLPDTYEKEAPAEVYDIQRLLNSLFGAKLEISNLPESIIREIGVKFINTHKLSTKLIKESDYSKVYLAIFIVNLFSDVKTPIKEFTLNNMTLDEARKIVKDNLGIKVGKDDEEH